MGVYVVAYLKLGVDGLLTVQAIVTIATIPLGYYFVKKYFIGGSYDKYWRKEIISYGYPFIFTMLAFWIFGSIDRWMLLFFIDAAEVGIYSIAVKFSMILLMVSTALGMAWSPISIKIKTDNPSTYKKIYADILLVILSIITGIAGFLMLFLGEVIGILLNEVYYPSLIPGIILIFSIVFQTTQQIYRYWYKYIEKNLSICSFNLDFLFFKCIFKLLSNREIRKYWSRDIHINILYIPYKLIFNL